MRYPRALRYRLSWFFRRSDVEIDLHDELQDYIERQTESYLAAGLSAEEARHAALRDVGGTEQVKEKCRDTRRVGWLEDTLQDLRYGWRTLSKSPLFTLMAVLSLALGIGANTAIYSVMDAMMVRALPVQKPGDLVILNWRIKAQGGQRQAGTVVQSHTGSSFDDPGGTVTSPDFPWPAYELLQSHNEVVTTLFAYARTSQLTLRAQGRAETAAGEFVSGNFFSGLGIVPAVGRLIADTDSTPGASRVAVLSYDYWRHHFAGDRAVIGKILAINDTPFTIAGVTPPEFFGVRPGSAPAVYIPLMNRPLLAKNYGSERDTMFTDSRFYWVDIMGRLRPGVALTKAQAELSARFHAFVLSSATTDKERANLPQLWLQEGGSGVDSLRRQYSKPLLVLLIMVAFILAIACANIANLLLARSSARRREMAVRLSLGAGRLRVIRQPLTESVLLAVPGGVLGVAIAAAGIQLLLWLLASGREDFILKAQLDWRVLTFTAAVAITAGLLSGLAPAIQATRVDVTPALKETRATAPRRRGRHIGLSQVLMLAQIALSLLLVLGATLFVRTLVNLHSVEIGFNQENLLTFNLDASQAGYKDAALQNFYARLNERLASVPGVRAATLSDLPLVSNGSHTTRVSIPGLPEPESVSTAYMAVGPTFFETMEIPIVLGRAINAHDLDGAPLAAVVNQVFVKECFPNQNPLGRHFKLGSGTGELTIVGVARNARYNSLKEAIPPVVYTSHLQNSRRGPPPPMWFEARTIGDPLALAETVRKIVHETDPRVPVTDVKTQTQRIDNTISQERTFADLCTAFAILALSIACVGLYGTMAYAVSRRTNEIGIRVALGAERRRILWMVLREVLAFAGAGLLIGLSAAWGSFSTIRSFVFGIKPADPVAMLSAAGFLLAALILAGLAPAIRAARIDPMVALRHE